MATMNNPIILLWLHCSSDILPSPPFSDPFHPFSSFPLLCLLYPHFLSPFHPLASSDLWTSIPCFWIFRCASRHDSWLLRLKLTFLSVGSWIPLARPLFNLLIVGYGASTFSVPLARFVRPDASAFMAKPTICKNPLFPTKTQYLRLWSAHYCNATSLEFINPSLTVLSTDNIESGTTSGRHLAPENEWKNISLEFFPYLDNLFFSVKASCPPVPLHLYLLHQKTIKTWTLRPVFNLKSLPIKSIRHLVWPVTCLTKLWFRRITIFGNYDRDL